MMIFALTGTLIGAMLGINFSVFALIPAMACALVIALATSVLGGDVSVRLVDLPSGEPASRLRRGRERLFRAATGCDEWVKRGAIR